MIEKAWGLRTEPRGRDPGEVEGAPRGSDAALGSVTALGWVGRGWWIPGEERWAGQGHSSALFHLVWLLSVTGLLYELFSVGTCVPLTER